MIDELGKVSDVVRPFLAVFHEDEGVDAIKRKEPIYEIFIYDFAKPNLNRWFIDNSCSVKEDSYYVMYLTEKEMERFICCLNSGSPKYFSYIRDHIDNNAIIHSFSEIKHFQVSMFD